MATVSPLNETILPPEKDGRQYVTYYFLSSLGDKTSIGPILEPVGVNIALRKSQLRSKALINLEKEEYQKNADKILNKGIPIGLVVYRYTSRTTALEKLYAEHENIVSDSINETIKDQNKFASVKTFLGK